jgi:hypothetical protein
LLRTGLTAKVRLAHNIIKNTAIIQSSGFVGQLIASDLQQLVCVVNTGSGNDQTLEVAVGSAISEEYAIRRSLASRRSHPEVPTIYLLLRINRIDARSVDLLLITESECIT